MYKRQVYPSAGLAVVSDSAFFKKEKSRKRAQKKSKPILSFADMKPGDYVVHDTPVSYTHLAVPILDGVHAVLENTPPELAGDIYGREILLTGNGGLIRGFDELIRRSTGINVVVAKDPGLCLSLIHI